MPFQVDAPDAPGVLVPTWLDSAMRPADNVVGAAVVAGAVVVVAGAAVVAVAAAVDGAVVAGAVVLGAVVAGATVVGDDVDAGADVAAGAVVVVLGVDVVGVVVVVPPEPDDGVCTVIGASETVGRAGAAWGPNVTGLFALPAALSTLTAPAVEPVGTVAVTRV